MKVAITGGTGFVGAHLAEALTREAHCVRLIARGLDSRNQSIRTLHNADFKPIGTGDEEKLVEAFQGCEAVAHCAGINRELQAGDYTRVHVEGTHNVVNAARRAGVKRIVLVSFFMARPDCGSAYHESKFAAEEIVRRSGLAYTVVKAGMIYGRGDHMLDHLSHIFHTLPFFALVGFQEKWAAPLAIEDMVKVMQAALVTDRLSRQTIAVVGPERMPLGEAVRRVAGVVGKVPVMFRMPLIFHYGFARLLEATMKVPLVSTAQVRILSEGFDQPFGECQSLPDDLLPTTYMTAEQIRKGLPAPGPFKCEDLRLCSPPLWLAGRS